MRNLIKVLLSMALVLIISASSAESKVLQARIPLDDIYDLYYNESSVSAWLDRVVSQQLASRQEEESFILWSVQNEDSSKS